MIKKLMRRKAKAAIVENMLVALISLVTMCAFLVIIFGAFSGIADKWSQRQIAREYLLLMETEGYLTLGDELKMLDELSDKGLYDISLTGTTLHEVNYGDTIYLKIKGTYDDNILSFAGGISGVAKHPTEITIERQSTAKQ